MEHLKPLENLAEPDERHQFFVVRDTPHCPYRKIAPTDFHEMAEQARLHRGVPEEVRSHFAMAQNLVAYSWYCYPFNVAAQLHAYISVEYALRLRLKASDAAPFKRLLKEATDLGLIKSTGFTYGREPEEQLYPPNVTLPGPPPEVRDYAADVADAMRSLRNHLAHGTTMLNMKGGTVLLVCSELINQLFVVPDSAAPWKLSGSWSRFCGLVGRVAPGSSRRRQSSRCGPLSRAPPFAIPTMKFKLQRDKTP